MKNLRLISLVFIVSAAAICLSGCNGIKKLQDIRITSASIGGIVPDGLKSLALECKVGVDNPGTQVALSNISCEVKHFGKVIGKVAIAPFTIEAKTEQDYNLTADVKLGENVTVFDLGRLFNKAEIDNFTVDIQAKAKVKGLAPKQLTYKDIPLKRLIETAQR